MRGPVRYLGGIRKEYSMKKARLFLSPIEYEYIELFGESPEVTLQKNPLNGSEIVQFRMNLIWLSMKSKNKKDTRSELEKEGCPWLT